MTKSSVYSENPYSYNDNVLFDAYVLILDRKNKVHKDA